MSQERTLEGKVAIVTGSVRRLGKAMAMALAKDGANVVVNARSSRDEAEKAAAEIEAAGGRTLVQIADITDEAAVGKMDGLIAAILRLSREGERRFRPEPLDMGALVRGLADAQRHQAARAGAAVEIGPLPDLTADRVAVEQIFGNLLDNAVKYLDPDRPGRVAVAGRRVGESAVFTVSDNGRGIAASDHARVFELFRRSGPQDRPGEGIGLAHVRALVRALGGQIDLASTVGAGTTFTVRLPLRA